MGFETNHRLYAVKRLQRLTGIGIPFQADNLAADNQVLVVSDADKVVDKETREEVEVNIVGKVL